MQNILDCHSQIKSNPQSDHFNGSISNAKLHNQVFVNFWLIDERALKENLRNICVTYHTALVCVLALSLRSEHFRVPILDAK